MYDVIKCALGKPSCSDQKCQVYSCRWLEEVASSISEQCSVPVLQRREGLSPWQVEPFAALAGIRLTTLSWKSGFRSEEVGRRAKAWRSITGLKVTSPGVNIRNGADSGDVSSSSSALGYNLASWRKKAETQWMAGDREGARAVSGKGRGADPQSPSLQGPLTSNGNITGWRALYFPELFPIDRCCGWKVYLAKVRHPNGHVMVTYCCLCRPACVDYCVSLGPELSCLVQERGGLMALLHSTSATFQLRST